MKAKIYTELKDSFKVYQMENISIITSQSVKHHSDILCIRLVPKIPKICIWRAKNGINSQKNTEKKPHCSWYVTFKISNKCVFFTPSDIKVQYSDWLLTSLKDICLYDSGKIKHQKSHFQCKSPISWLIGGLIRNGFPFPK